LTPKAFEEIKSKAYNFSKKIENQKKQLKSEFKHSSNMTPDLNNSADYASKRASSMLPDVISRNKFEPSINRKSV
jgi:hypothetical protein